MAIMARMGRWRGTICGTMVCVFALAAWARSSLPRNPPAVTLSARHWTTIRLPATPLGIAAHGKDLWVCGWDEMIAESRDGGRTWRIRHFRHNGELLFALGFAAPHHVYAFGAEDISLASKNGGRSWGDWGSPGFTVTQAFFAGPKRDFLVGPRGFAFGYPGGWSGKTARGLVTIASAALLSGRRAVLLMDLAGGRGGPAIQSWLWRTADGGDSWPAIRFTTLDPEYVAAADGRYLLVGAANGADPTLITSVHGGQWHPIAGVERTGHDCNAEGCRDGGWRPFAKISSFTRPWVYPAPRDRRLFTAWAAVPGVICDVGGSLRCVLTGARKADPPARRRETGGRGGDVRAARCIRCAQPAYPRAARANRVQGPVLLDALIGKHGRLRQLALAAAPDAALATAAMRTVARWRYSPTLLNGRPVEVRTEIAVNFRLTR